jgi:hypothetical protein
MLSIRFTISLMTSLFLQSWAHRAGHFIRLHLLNTLQISAPELAVIPLLWANVRMPTFRAFFFLLWITFVNGTLLPPSPRKFARSWHIFQEVREASYIRSSWWKWVFSLIYKGNIYSPWWPSHNHLLQISSHWKPFLIGLPVDVKPLFIASAFENNARGPNVDDVKSVLAKHGVDCETHKMEVRCVASVVIRLSDTEETTTFLTVFDTFSEEHACILAVNVHYIFIVSLSCFNLPLPWTCNHQL